MPQPYDYGIRANPLPDPTQNFLQGLQLVQAMRQQQAEQEQARQAKQVFADLAALGKNATAEDIYQASLKAPKYAEMFQKNFSVLAKEKQDALFNGGADAFVKLAGDPKEAVASLNQWADGFENSGDKQAADQFRMVAKIAEHDPQAARTTLGTLLSFADGERFKNVAQPSEATTFQKDFNFIKQTFGDDAAAEYAQYGRDSVVSLPMGNGQTYVGPAATAPGASRWQAKGADGAPAAQPESAPEILQKAASSKTITQAEAGVIRQSLGPKGQAAFDEWQKKNGIKVIVRTGTDANGRRVVQYADGTVGYAGDGGGNATGGFRE